MCTFCNIIDHNVRNVPVTTLKYFLICFVSDFRVGRRITLCTAMLLGGTACVLIQFIPVKYVTVITGLALCGKLSISASFSVAYVHR